MIVSGKNLKQAIKKGSASIKKCPSPVLACRFDTHHSLYRDKKDTKPLFSCSFKGDLRLPIFRILFATAAGAIFLSLFCAHVRKKLAQPCKQKK